MLVYIISIDPLMVLSVNLVSLFMSLLTCLRLISAHVHLYKLRSWIHAPSGRVYSYSYKPPKVEGKDDITGEDLIQRDDDKPDCVRQRLAQYDETTAPLVDFYEKKGVLKTFQGTMSDVIYPEVKNWLDEKLAHD